MTQTDRDRLVALKKARDKKMTQRQAAEEMRISDRQVRRLLVKMKRKGDGAVIHELRGRRSNRRSKEETKHKAIEVLQQDVYRASRRMRFGRFDAAGIALPAAEHSRK